MSGVNENINLSTNKFILIIILTTIIANVSWNYLINVYKYTDVCQSKWVSQRLKNNLFYCNRERGILARNIKNDNNKNNNNNNDFPFMGTQIMEVGRYSNLRDEFSYQPLIKPDDEFKFSEHEAKAVLIASKNSRQKGNFKKAQAIIENALSKSPFHTDILMEYGIILEKEETGIIQADSIYTKVLNYNPYHSEALIRRQRTLPIVQEHDNKIMKALYDKRDDFFNIRKNMAAFRRALKESYFQHVYHTVALEGNTMDYVQTRTFLETGRVVGGKSIFEHNEILGLDAALRFLNQSKIQLGEIGLDEILQIHYKVMAYVDPESAGKLRRIQVYVGGFTPPAPQYIVSEMKNFVEWLNDYDTLQMDPVELAAIAHYKLVFIHPFVDGNGRTARLLMNLILSRSGFPPIIIPLEERLNYYKTLKEANDGDLRPFIRFIVQQTDKTLQYFIDTTTANLENEDRNNAQLIH
uniref:protein adenylyltransferase n=1 Tax=Parastrongyloides trichosuri TaxID=131310 RepID=A0A0N4Z9N4_PARTI